MRIIVDGEPRDVDLTSDYSATAWTISYVGDLVLVSDDDGRLTSFQTPRYSGIAGVAASDGAIISPMPGRIIAVDVAAGAAVTKGQKLVTLEAMKMEHSLVAPFDGTVTELSATAGAQVGEGALLARIEPTAGD